MPRLPKEHYFPPFQKLCQENAPSFSEHLVISNSGMHCADSILYNQVFSGHSKRNTSKAGHFCSQNIYFQSEITTVLIIFPRPILPWETVCYCKFSMIWPDRMLNKLTSSRRTINMIEHYICCGNLDNPSSNCESTIKDF